MNSHAYRRSVRNLDAMTRLEVAHVTFELSEKDQTFALIPGQALNAKDRKPLFSGIITKEMGVQLRILANEIEEIIIRGEAK